MENLFEAFSVVNAEVDADAWGAQVCTKNFPVCTKNFPVGTKERDCIVELLDEFCDVIVGDLDGTKARVPAMKVELKPNVVYEGVKARRYSPEKTKVIREWLDKMVRQGVVRKSSSTTSSPLLVVQDTIQDLKLS